ncbi:glycosyltransferase 87 family protein [Actinokineospora iranica]|uniref:Alpha-1,2-mannosyltransferase n=1 Tax=Actinokineospora iranica TaxID=1271860 RepID=A0A1G6TRP8_9PSEU|nr:glycosyltransferase 87 family protein [Actinokineospora iranica]SDD31156.1 alpha-1,2-mannosyltransferase [Actinokineospora iranica]
MGGDTRRVPVVVTGLMVGVVGLAVAYWLAGWGLGVDSSVYRAGALTLLHGDSLYAPLTTGEVWAPPLPFTYPPIAGLVFVPLTMLPAQLAWGAVAALSALALGVVLRASLPGALRQGWRFAALFLAVLALEPVWRSLGLGQVNLILMAMVVVDVLLLRGAKASGLLIGLAAAVKLTPLIFVAHLVVTRRWADAGRALGAFAALNLLAAAALPGDTVRFWTEALVDGNDATTNSWFGNQSLNGLLQRATGEGRGAFLLYVVVALFVLAVAALVVHRLDRRGESMGALLVTAFAGLLVSPVSWTHHWVWVVPLAGFLLRLASVWSWTALGVLVLVFTGWQFRMVPSGAKVELHWSPGHALLGNAYVLAALVFTPVIATLALRARGRRAEVLAGTASRS